MQEKKENLKKKNQLPWYSISLLLTILGSISIVLLFGVRYYNEQGIVFWSIVFSWFIILLAVALEISRLERLRRKIDEEKEKLIIELSEALGKKKERE